MASDRQFAESLQVGRDLAVDVHQGALHRGPAPPHRHRRSRGDDIAHERRRVEPGCCEDVGAHPFGGGTRHTREEPEQGVAPTARFESLDELTLPLQLAPHGR